MSKKEFKFPTLVSVIAKQAASAFLNSDEALKIKSDDSPIKRALLHGAVVVQDRADPELHFIADINTDGALYNMRRTKYQILNKPKDDRFIFRTLHLKGEWAGADDDLLRMCCFAKTNLYANDNAYRVSQVVGTGVIERPATQSTNSKPKLAVEHVIDTGVKTEFQDLNLLEIFKFVNEVDDLITAIKVGKSTAIVGIELDKDNNLLNVLTHKGYSSGDPDTDCEKIRLKKTTLVCRVMRK